MESNKRSIIKALTWRFVAIPVTIFVTYSFTKEPVLAMGIGFVDAVIRTVAYYSHERLWNRTSYGRRLSGSPVARV